jgi:hypothetical protein
VIPSPEPKKVDETVIQPEVDQDKTDIDVLSGEEVR